MKIFRLFFVLLSVVSPVQFAAAGPKKEVTEMTIQDLYELSLQKKTIPATLDSLPDIFKNNFTLIYNSPSMQGSTFQHPRALLSNEDASLVITFNGDPEQRGYNHLEAVQFVKEEGRWEFYDLNFEGDTPQLSSPNPGVCMSCHQYPGRTTADPRPNWEPYNLWPNSYGSLGGELDPARPENADAYYSKPRLLNAESLLPGFLERQNQESDQLICFIRRQVMGQKDECAPDSHDSYDRYRNLNLNMSNRKVRINAGLHELSGHLAKNNFVRVLRLMKEQPYYDSVKYVLGAYLLAYSYNRVGKELIDFTNPACTHPLSAENMNKLIASHRKWQSASQGYYVPISEEDLLPYEDRQNVTRYIDLLFGPRAGQEFQDWSMDFRTGGRFLHDSQRRFRAAGSSAQWFSEVFFAEETEMRGMSCEAISAEANRRLDEAFSTGLLN
jgi:hypothetical protein